MKKILLSLVALFMGVGMAVAQSEIIYSLEPVAGKNSNYAGNCDVDINGITWNVEGNTQYKYNNEMQLYRFGGKSTDSAPLKDQDRALTSKTPMVGEVSKIVLSVYRINIKLNSAKLLIADNADFANAQEVAIEGIAKESDTEVNVSAPAGSYYKFVFNVTNATKDNQYLELKQIDFYGAKPADAVDAPVFSIDGGAYFGAQTVELSAAEGCEIYYTLDETDPTTESTKYTAPITIEKTTTVKAIAVKDGVSSLVATEVYNIIVKTMTLSELHAAATSKDTEVAVNTEGWLCSGVKGTNNAYFTDGEGLGILLYSNNHGFKVGDKLSGVVVTTLTLYGGAAELKNLNATDENLTITPGQEVPVLEMNVSELSSASQGALVVLKGLTYSNAKFYQGEDAIAPYKTFMTLPAFKEDVVYDITGVVTYYNTIQISPRTADDIVESNTTGIADVDAAKSVANGKFVENGRVVIVKVGKKYNVAGQNLK